MPCLRSPASATDATLIVREPDQDLTDQKDPELVRVSMAPQVRLPQWNPYIDLAETLRGMSGRPGILAGQLVRSRFAPSQRRRLRVRAAQRLSKLPAGTDAQLCENLAQMPFDGAMAEEELLADLRVREAIVSQASDLRFFRRERLMGSGGALSYPPPPGPPVSRRAPRGFAPQPPARTGGGAP